MRIGVVDISIQTLEFRTQPFFKEDDQVNDAGKSVLKMEPATNNNIFKEQKGKKFIKGTVTTDYRTREFVLSGTIVGNFLVSDEFYKYVEDESNSREITEENKKSSTEIMRLLIDKFRVYVGLLSSEAREIATFPELSEKPTIDGDKK
ncbi:hypothetical protein [Lacticaseibacillus pantheris]|uniref:hypothetical protein n=1 Tax=Lacticaseibacillus pantheris TaxID=171523 RepID=UPI00070563C6|nr:hypothetical protein [Lacticaseibacillus pantheris]